MIFLKGKFYEVFEEDGGWRIGYNRELYQIRIYGSADIITEIKVNRLLDARDRDAWKRIVRDSLAQLDMAVIRVGQAIASFMMTM